MRFGLLGLVIELLLPAALAATVLLVAARYIAFWDLKTTIGLGVFGVLMVVISVAVSIWVDALTLAGRQRRGKRQLLNRAGPWSRLVKFVLGGIVIPIAALVAANRTELGNHGTPMSLAIEASRPKSPASHAALLGDAVLHATSPEVKAGGVTALQTVRSPEALDQLVRILTDDPGALADPGVRHSLSTALASFGPEAVPGLLQVFGRLTPGPKPGVAPAAGGAWERSFATAFAALEEEIKRRALDPALQATELARLQAAQADLQRALDQIDLESGTSADSSLPSFIMRTFLAMKLTQNADVLALARRVVDDTAWPDAVRGQALLLIAKVGGKDDLDALYSHLQDASPLLQASAMRAIATLQTRVAAAESGS